MQKQSTPQPSLFWSARLRHPSRSLPKYSQKIKPNCSLVLCLIDQPIVTSSQQWFFKMKQISSYQICIGMCLQSFAVAGKFEDDTNWSTDNNHGQYIITNSGKSFQHKRHNGRTSLGIGTGDVLRVSYDIKQQILVFQKQGKEFEMKVETPPSGDCYRFCLYVYTQNHIIEMIPFREYKDNKRQQNIDTNVSTQRCDLI